jgi:Fic family protein
MLYNWSYFHNSIEAIHGFADFNGRLGRVLINYILIGNDLPPIIVFEEDKRDYYSALEYFNEEQEIDKMVRFLELQFYKTWNEVRGILE